MKTFLCCGVLILLCVASVCWGLGSAYPETPGNIFIREKVGDFNAFKAAFLDQRQNLKTNGFSGYSLHRDLYKPSTFIMTLKCSDLRKGVLFVQSSIFRTAMEKGKIEDLTLWAGADVVERKYENRPKMIGGIVIVKNKVRSYAFWKTCFDAEGKHRHQGRGYKPSRYSFHNLTGKQDVVLVVHEASDVTKAPSFMTSAAMKGTMEAMGVVGLEIWYGFNLEEGMF